MCLLHYTGSEEEKICNSECLYNSTYAYEFEKFDNSDIPKLKSNTNL